MMWFKFHFQGYVTRELIADGGSMVTGQSAMAAPNRRLENMLPIKISEENVLVRIFIACYRQEAESWLPILNLGGAPATEGGLKPRPVKRLKAAPLMMDVEAGFVVDRVSIRSLQLIHWLRSIEEQSLMCLPSGKCISQSLVCNGDQDCEEDGLDEICPIEKYIVCTKSTLPPNIELLGLG